MNNLFLMLTLVVLAACSKNGSESNPSMQQENEIKNEIIFEALTVKTTSVEGENTIPAASLDFAVLQSSQSAIQDLVIQNTLSSPLVFEASDIVANDIAPFVMTETCSNKSIGRSRSCKLSFSISNTPSPSELVLTKSLTVKGTVVQLTATLAAELPPVASPVVGISVSPTLLDFGVMKNGDVKELSVIVSNKGLTTQTIPAPVITNPKIAISNTCSSLLRNRYCTMKFSYTASSDESVSQEMFTSIANNEIKHSVLVQSPVAEIVNITPSVASSSVSLTEPQIINGSILFTNKGTAALPSPVILVAQPSIGITVNPLPCSGGLSRNRSCSVSYSLNSALLPEGASQIELKLQSGTISSASHDLNITTVKSGGEAVVSFNAVENTPSCSTLNLQACAGTQNISRTHSCQKLLDGIIDPSYVSNPADCSLPDSSPVACYSPAGNKINSITGGTQTVSCEAGGIAQTFQSVSCDSNYVISGQICSLGIVSFSPTYASTFSDCSALTACSGIGTKIKPLISCQKFLNGSPVSGGQLSDCSGFADSIGETCQSPAGVIQNPILYGTQTVSCQEGSTEQVVQSVSCEEGYEANGNICSAVSFQPIYSGVYGQCSASLPCDGEGEQQSQIESCQKLLDGQPVVGGNILDCLVGYSEWTSRSCNSPSGQISVSISNGEKNVFCAEGTGAQEFVSLSCLSGFIANNSQQSCDPAPAFIATNNWSTILGIPTYWLEQIGVRNLSIEQNFGFGLAISPPIPVTDAYYYTAIDTIYNISFDDADGDGINGQCNVMASGTEDAYSRSAYQSYIPETSSTACYDMAKDLNTMIINNPNNSDLCLTVSASGGSWSAVASNATMNGCSDFNSLPDIAVSCMSLLDEISCNSSSVCYWDGMLCVE